MSDKRQLIALIQADLQREIEATTAAARAAHEAATHEESRAEDAHDTRGLEASYLAGAQAARVEQLKRMVAAFQFATLPDFGPGDAIELGALVTLSRADGRGDHGKETRYLLVEHGGGITVSFEGAPLQLITPQAPLGEALLGRKAGETVEVEGQPPGGAPRELKIIAIR